jgi:hypothetical protein
MLTTRNIVAMLMATAGSCTALTSPAHALQTLSDNEMSMVTGQSLFASTYVAPGGSNPNTSVGFYRLGVEANMAINANIDKLRLGCDGAGGTGLCDISLDHIRFAGLTATETVNSGPPTDFLLNNPFFEFAIKNPNTPATRQVVGIRFGALQALGSLTVGENPDGSVLGETGESGINTMSGDMTANIINAKLTNVNTCIGLGLFGACLGIPLKVTATVDTFTQQLVLKRAASVPDLGPMTAVALGIVTLSNTHISNEPLRAIHRIEVKNTDGTPTNDFYLSMQSQNIIWQKVSTGAFTGVPAQTGWWMSLPQVVLQDIVSDARIDLGILALAGGIFGANVTVPGVDLGQKPVSNCWGSTNFC